MVLIPEHFWRKNVYIIIVEGKYDCRSKLVFYWQKETNFYLCCLRWNYFYNIIKYKYYK